MTVTYFLHIIWILLLVTICTFVSVSNSITYVILKPKKMVLMLTSCVVCVYVTRKIHAIFCSDYTLFVIKTPFVCLVRYFLLIFFFILSVWLLAHTVIFEPQFAIFNVSWSMALIWLLLFVINICWLFFFFFISFFVYGCVCCVIVILFVYTYQFIIHDVLK